MVRNNDKKDSYDDFFVHRKRYTYNLENPFSIKCTEEVTVYNSSGMPFDSLYYQLGMELETFRPHLTIYDSKRELLEFKLANANDRPQDGNKNLIEILLPNINEDNPCFLKTIYLEYTIDCSDHYSGNRGKFKISLKDSKNVYVHIKLNDDYEFKGKYFVKSNGSFGQLELRSGVQNQNEPDLFEFFFGDPEWKIKIYKKYSYIDILINDTKGLLPDAELGIYFSITLPKRRKKWYQLGILFGLATMLFNLWVIALEILQLDNLTSCISIATALTAASITFLIVIKGWLFTQRMDRAVHTFATDDEIEYRIPLSDIDVGRESRTFIQQLLYEQGLYKYCLYGWIREIKQNWPYDRLYRVIIIVLLIEIFLILVALFFFGGNSGVENEKLVGFQITTLIIK